MPKVLIPLAQGCEELEAVTLIDLLRRAQIEVTTAGLDEGPVTASRGVVLLPDTTIDKVLQGAAGDEFDMIVLPGGLPGADHLMNDPRIQQRLKQQIDAGKYVAAICAAPKALARAGLLAGHQATAYPGTLEALNLENTLISAEDVVIDDKILTSRGPGTAMDFALTLIEQLLDGEIRDAVEAGLVR